MRQEAIHNYLETYFRASGCDILETRPHFLKVKLTVDLDKQLMNRPFYWHYVEKLGNQPETATLTLKTAFNGDEGEIIHFGSPRLHQIFQSTKEMARYIRLYENVHATDKKTALEPWLCVNTKVSYCCDIKKDMLLSLGLNLLNGTILRDFHDSLLKLDLTPKIPDFCYTMSPIIKPISGLKRLEAIIEQLLGEEEHKWAEAAHKRWNNDLDLLNRFYQAATEEEVDEQSFQQNYENEKEALRSQYEPHINVSIINGGVFYLKQGRLIN